MKEYTIDELAQMIDHTNLHTDASKKDMEKLCNEAKDYHFKMVAINQVQSHLCACLLYTSPSPRDLSTSRMPSSA